VTNADKPRAREPRAGEPHGGEPARPGFWQRRRDRFVAEIERNRAGGHRIPTWVLALALVAMLAAWAAVITLS
jgi:hypothetical protein